VSPFLFRAWQQNHDPKGFKLRMFLASREWVGARSVWRFWVLGMTAYPFSCLVLSGTYDWMRAGIGSFVFFVVSLGYGVLKYGIDRNRVKKEESARVGLR